MVQVYIRESSSLPERSEGKKDVLKQQPQTKKSEE